MERVFNKISVSFSSFSLFILGSRCCPTRVFSLKSIYNKIGNLCSVSIIVDSIIFVFWFLWFQGIYLPVNVDGFSFSSVFFNGLQMSLSILTLIMNSWLFSGNINYINLNLLFVANRGYLVNLSIFIITVTSFVIKW